MPIPSLLPFAVKKPEYSNRNAALLLSLPEIENFFGGAEEGFEPSTT
jgi:hypothetical protein